MCLGFSILAKDKSQRFQACLFKSFQDHIIWAMQSTLMLLRTVQVYNNWPYVYCIITSGEKYDMTYETNMILKWNNCELILSPVLT